MATFLKHLSTARGDEMSQYLSAVLLPSLNFPTHVSEDFVSKLRSQDVRAYRRTFCAFINTLKVQQNVEV